MSTPEPTGVLPLLAKLQEAVDRARAARGEEPAPLSELLTEPEPRPTVQALALGCSIEEVGDALAELDQDTLRLKDVDDFDTALVLLQQANAMAAEAKRIAGAFHDRAWALRGEAWGDYHHPDLGVVSVRRTSARARWDHEATAERVIEQHLADAGGEVPGDPAVVMRWLLEAGAISYWRKTVLKALGISPKDEDLLYDEPGNPSITFPSASG